MSPEMRNAHPIALVTLALMFLCAPFLLQTVAQEPQTPSAASTTAPAPSTPLVELVRSLAWPVSALVMAFAFRRPIAAFVTALGTRVTKLSVFKVELELVPATSATSTPLLDDIRTATTSAPISDSSRMMLEQVQSGTLADYATIDIGTGDEWLTSRLFIAATMLERMRGLQVMVFLESTTTTHERFVAVAPVQVGAMVTRAAVRIPGSRVGTRLFGALSAGSSGGRGAATRGHVATRSPYDDDRATDRNVQHRCSRRMGRTPARWSVYQLAPTTGDATTNLRRVGPPSQNGRGACRVGDHSIAARLAAT